MSGSEGRDAGRSFMQAHDKLCPASDKHCRAAARQQQVTRAQAAIDNDVSAESLEDLEKKEGPGTLTLTIECSNSLTYLVFLL